MQSTIQYIEKELAELYPISEIRGFVRLIFEYVTGMDYNAQQVQKNEKIIVESELKEIVKIVGRLKQYEPIQYILGKTEFYGLELKVSPAVLIPRPETEELVDWIVKEELLQGSKVLDVGTGSGCIALAIKKHVPEASISAMDVSEKALQIAQENARLNRLNVDFIQADVLYWEKSKWPFFNVIVSNPPYVRELEKESMLQNVLDHEPDSALFVTDKDPLIFYRRIGEFAMNYLQNKGALFFEINENLAVETVELLEELGFKNIQVRKDLNGKHRMLRCVK